MVKIIKSITAKIINWLALTIRLPVLITNSQVLVFFYWFLGISNAALGSGNELSGSENVVAGHENKVAGKGNLVAGQGNIVVGSNASP